MIIATTIVVVERTSSCVSRRSNVASPAFIPMANVLSDQSPRVLSAPLGAAIRWKRRREIGDVLDLTRAPEAMLALIVKMRTPLSTRTRFGGRQQQAVPSAGRGQVERWRQSRRVTLLFTDIANSTELLHELGDKQLVPRRLRSRPRRPVGHRGVRRRGDRLGWRWLLRRLRGRGTCCPRCVEMQRRTARHRGGPGTADRPCGWVSTSAKPSGTAAKLSDAR